MQEKKAENIDRLITQEQIRAFDVSDPTCTAVKLTEKYSAAPGENSHPSQSEYNIPQSVTFSLLHSELTMPSEQDHWRTSQ